MTIDPERRVLLAAEAERNEVLQEAFTMLNDAYIAALRKCDARDDMGRYRYSVALGVIEKVRGHLSAVMMVAKVDAKTVKDLDEPKRWIPRF